MKIIRFFLLLEVVISWNCSPISDVQILPRSEWKANPPKPYEAQIPERITIHHEGVVFNDDQNSAEHIKRIQVWGMGIERSWSDIPYHFLIDRKGKIYEGRNVFTVGETATDYNPSGHLLITCIGNFEEQELTREQLDSLIKLIACCCEKYQISPETIAGHKDYAETLCPGKNLYKYIKNGFLQDKVKKLLK